MKILIREGSKVEFSEVPATMYGEDYVIGTVNWINVHLNTVEVEVPTWGLILFSLDGSAWSDGGQFKRETVFVTWE